MVTTDVQPVSPRKFQFIGGELCLDFTNTMGGSRGGVPREFLHSYAELISWAEQGGVVNPREAETLMEQSRRHPDEAQDVLRRAIQLREAVYRIFFGVGQGKSPKPADLELLNGELARSLNRLRVAEQSRTFLWGWADTVGTLDAPLGPVARSAAELLTSRGFEAHIHSCQGQNCGWLFLDSSKNHSRRWCDMRDCGNRAKVKRHRQKRAKS